MKKPMTIRQRILALDAAVVAAEMVGMPDDLRAAIDLLNDALDEYFQSTEKAEDFDKFLEEQYAAVQMLANSPEAFGRDI